MIGDWFDAALGSAPDPLLARITLDRLADTLMLRSYNTRIVVVGVTVLGGVAGAVGTFLLLRKRSLTADALAHATLPGVALAFIFMVLVGGDGKWLPGLLLGALLFGLVGMALLLAIRQTTRLKDDAALGIVLSVLFGLGMALVKLAETTPGGSAAGLMDFIYGKAASMVAADAWTILVASIVISITCGVLFKELKLLCFDTAFGRSQGWPVLALDAALMAMVLCVTVVGLQAVGLLLVVAMLIVPPAAARFWTERLGVMVLIAAGVGAISAYVGASVSALDRNLPTGPLIVLAGAAVFGGSILFGARRGAVVRGVRRWSLARRVARQHLLRAMYEANETRDGVGHVTVSHLVDKRSWSARTLRRLVRRAKRRRLIRYAADGSFALTESGRIEARRCVRNHRLWETYLIEYADIAPSHVDRDADAIEHVLGPQLVDRLETLLEQRAASPIVPASPHPIGRGDAAFAADNHEGGGI